MLTPKGQAAGMQQKEAGLAAAATSGQKTQSDELLPAPLRSSCAASALQLAPAPASSPPAPAARAAAPAAHDVPQSRRPRLPPVHLARNAPPAHQDLPQRAPQ